MKNNRKDYVQMAETAIKELNEEAQQKYGFKYKDKIVTTSKIRNLLAMTADIYNQVVQKSSETLDEEICERIEYLRIRFIYEYGRDDSKEKSVRNFIDKTGILELLKEIGNSRSNYIRFSRYMEALVAFHKYYGGKDQ